MISQNQLNFNLPKALTEEILRASGIHIGTNYVTKHMESYVKEKSPTGVALFDLNTILQKINVAGKFIASYEPDSVLFYSGNPIIENSLKCVNKLTGSKVRMGRYAPGTFTNTLSKDYVDTNLLVISNPMYGMRYKKGVIDWSVKEKDTGALWEAAKVGIPTVAFCNSDAIADYIDLIIPFNNKGRKAVATGYYLLTRSIMLNRGLLKEEEDLPLQITDFEAPAQAEGEALAERDRQSASENAYMDDEL